MKKFIAKERMIGVKMTHDNAEELERWTQGTLVFAMDRNADGGPTLLFQSEGCNTYAQVGDYILMDPDHEFYVFNEEDIDKYYDIAYWQEEEN